MDMGSTDSLRLLKRWLTVCNRYHRCAPVDAPLPDRVLKIAMAQDSISIKLVETSGEDGQYIALSHCWGVPPTSTLKTLTDNIEAFKQDIPFAQLSRTFQDAVTITKELGIEFLWIDSLCIIQDSEDDWIEQSSRMSDIYCGAWLTVSASASTSSESGCFVPHPAVYNSPDANNHGMRDTRPAATATALVRLSDGTVSKLYFFPEETPVGGVYSMEDVLDPLRYDPINSRAWTFQERILSPRTIHYGVDQMYWECLDMFCGEDGLRAKPMIPKIQEKGSWDWDETLADLWHELVRQYSKRNLTYGSDKLPALSGLAFRFFQLVDDEYYAGIWAKRLWKDLLWRVALSTEWIAYGINYMEDWDPYRDQIQTRDPNPAHDYSFIELERWRLQVNPECPALPEPPTIRDIRFGTDERTYTPKRPDKYRAPSWSFASMDALINWIPPNHQVVARCQSIHVEHRDTEPFGQVTGGQLVLIVCPTIPNRKAVEGY
jgi:hypothetical protein